MITNHVTLSMISKGILGGAMGLITKGILTQLVLEIVTKKGGIGRGGVYDADYWKRWRRDLDEDDEIDYIVVKIRKKWDLKKYEITAEFVKPLVEAELIKNEIISKDNIPDIRVEFLEEIEEKKPKVKPIIHIEQVVEKTVKEKTTDQILITPPDFNG